MFFDACTETVSILYAAIFGAGEACIDVSMGSLGMAFAAFIFLVIIAQLAARRLWRRLTRPAPRPLFDEDELAKDHSTSQPLGRGDTESPIKSSRF